MAGIRQQALRGREHTGFLRRIAPAVGLFFLAPLIAEFLLGNVSVTAVGSVFALAPLYGGGAVLVREVTRRSGRGWPTMLLLSGAYALVEEGLATQTLFNPSYYGLDLLSPARIPGLGMSAWWTLFVLTLHVVWSMGVSIALVEALVPARHREPWLGGPGLGVVGVLYVLGVVSIAFVTYQSERFVASVPQLAGAVVAVVVLIALAFRIGSPGRAGTAGAVPSPWLVGTLALLTSSLFLGLSLVSRGSWLIVAIYLGLYALVSGLVTTWARRAGWTDVHRLALAGGALMAYAWYGFPATPLVGAGGTVDLIGNTVFATAAIALLVAAIRATSRAQSVAKPPE
ncbi:MAG TPA: hypothetical protein VHH34_14370 [Pseudonocardiaceae bacterium]|nr:hypothetical protein [Pseudonocardiaceae bacterium]